MKKKKIIQYISYFCIFLLMFLTEKEMGIRPFALGFFMALIYCRQNALILCPLYIAASMAITPSVTNIFFALTPCVVILTAYFIHYKIKRKITLIAISLYTLIAEIPLFIFFTEDIYQISNTIISVLGAQMFTYCSIVFLFPLLVRGLKYKLSHDEKLSFSIILAVVFMGISFLSPFGFSVYYLAAVYLILMCKEIFYSSTPVIAAIIGLGGALAQSQLLLLGMIVCFCASAMAFRETNIYITAAGVIISYFVFNYFFGEGINIIEIAAVAAGCILAVFTPKKWTDKLKTAGVAASDRYVTRTVLNRDRNDIAKRLSGLAKVFYEMQDILKFDLADSGKEYSESFITNEINIKCCKNCPYYGNCNEVFGNTSYMIESLALAAMNSGKATLLDIPPMLTSQCKRMNNLLTTTNEVVTRYKKRQEINSSIEQGREMIIDQMGGVGLMLDKLGKDVESSLSYDTTKEKKLIDEFAAINVVAGDVMVYGKDKVVDKVTLIVREADCDKQNLAEIISAVMQIGMIENKRENNIKGTVTMHFSVAPKFDILYGEASVALDGALCGDNRQALRLSDDKLMLILSDGMGNGEKAYRTSMNAILMIESFYKAGFDHNTVLSCVGRLLGLREEEDFNALDIVVIDVRKGSADFIKQGGRESFIMSGNNVEIIDCGSLPLGIINEASPIIEQKKLLEGDFVILLSDGVMDILGADMVRDILLTANTLNPQVLAEMLVNNACRVATGNAKKDDMSCIVARIFSR